MSLEILSADTTIYVRTTGNDTTGDGSSSTPYATVGRAIERIHGMWIGDYAVTVDIGAGTFGESPLRFEHPSGRQVRFEGVTEDTNNCTVTSVGSKVVPYYNGEAVYVYCPVTIQLPVGKSTAVGEYLRIRTVSGGTNPKTLLGCHQVTSWTSGTREAVVRMYLPISSWSTLPSGSISCDVTAMRSVLDIAHTGLTIKGPYHGGIWDHLVFECYNAWAWHGVEAHDGACVSFLSNFVITQCGRAFYAKNNATIFADGAHCSGVRYMAFAENSAVVSLRGTTGHSIVARAVEAKRSSVYAPDIYAVMLNGTFAYADYKSVIDFLRASCDVMEYTGNLLYAARGSFISAVSTGIDTSDNSLLAPDVNTVGNFAAYIYDPAA